MSLWKHETQRIMRDRICRFADVAWFDETLEEIVKEVSNCLFKFSERYTIRIPNNEVLPVQVFTKSIGPLVS